MNTNSRALRFVRRSWDTVALALAIAAFLATSLPLSRIAAWIPRIVLLVTLALIFVQLVREAREQFGNTREPTRPAMPVSSAGSRESTRQDIAVSKEDADTASSLLTRSTPPAVAVLWVLGLLLSVLLLGTTIGSTLFCFAYLRWHAREALMTSGIFALGLGASVQLAFGAILKAELYRGWLWQLAQ